VAGAWSGVVEMTAPSAAPQPGRLANGDNFKDKGAQQKNKTLVCFENLGLQPKSG